MPTAGTEAVKQWLSRFRQQTENIERLTHELDTLESRATSPGIASLDGLPRAPGFDGDRMGWIVGQMDELREEIKEKQIEATATRREIEAAIKKINGPQWPDRRAVLRFRYLICLSWADVVDALFGGKRDFLAKEEAYQRRAYRLHSDALLDLVELVPTKAGQEIAQGVER